MLTQKPYQQERRFYRSLLVCLPVNGIRLRVQNDPGDLLLGGHGEPSLCFAYDYGRVLLSHLTWLT